MNIKLKISQRIQLIGLLNEYKGNISGLYRILKLMDQLEISDKEAKEIGLKVITNEKGRINWTWDNKKEKEKGIDFQDSETGFIKQLIDAKNSRGEFTLADRIILEITEKLGIKIDEKEDEGIPEKSNKTQS